MGHPIVQECFTGTVSRLGGIGFPQLAEEVRLRHRIAYPDNPDERAHRTLEGGGEYQWRREGEYHLFNPETVFKLQHATREGRYDIFKQYTEKVDAQSERLATLRGLFRFRTSERESRYPSMRWSRSRPSWPASPPGPCPTARSQPKHTRRWPSP